MGSNTFFRNIFRRFPKLILCLQITYTLSFRNATYDIFYNLSFISSDGIKKDVLIKPILLRQRFKFCCEDILKVF